MSKRYEWIDTLRGIAIISVYLVHSILVYPIDISDNIVLRKVSLVIVPFYMPLFFLIAGYCFRKKSYLENVKERAMRLLIPYVFLNIITMMTKILGGGMVHSKINLGSDIRDWILYGGHYWFLYVLFFISLLMPITEWIRKNIYTEIAGLICICVLGILCRNIGIFCIDLVLWYYFFFILGVVARKWDIIDSLSRKRKVGISLCSLVLYGTALTVTETINLHNYIVNLILALLGCISCEIFVCALEKRQGIIKQFIVSAGRYSLQFYLLNGYLLVCARVFFIQILKLENVYLIYILIVLSNLIGALIVSKIIEKSKILSFIFGVRISAI